MRSIIALNILLLVASVVVTISALVKSSDGAWSEEMVLWLMPYLVIFGLQILLYLAKPLRRPVVGSGLVTWLVVLLCVVSLYGQTALGSSSTAGVAFLVGPFYLLFGAPCIFLAGVWIGYMLSRWAAFKANRSTQPPCCAKCGYLLVGLTELRCPECAEPFAPNTLGHGDESVIC